MIKSTRTQLAVAENALLEILACRDFGYAKGIASRAMEYITRVQKQEEEKRETLGNESAKLVGGE